MTDGLFKAVQRLLPQLSSSAGPAEREHVAEIVASPATVLLVARAGPEGTGEGDGPEGKSEGGGPQATSDGDDIVGMLTLVVFRIPTGVRAWVEDVVVDRACRGQGIGEALLRKAVEVASAHGARTVDLTSRPARESANRLYQRAGFEQRDTNVYRYRPA